MQLPALCSRKGMKARKEYLEKRMTEINKFMSDLEKVNRELIFGFLMILELWGTV